MSTPENPVSITSLRALIGRELVISDRQCVIVDVLEDGPQLVMQVCGETSIQADQWGDAHRRTPETFSLSIYDSDGTALNQVLSGLIKESARSV